MRGTHCLLPRLDRIEVAGVKVAYRLFGPQAVPRGAVLFIHGWGGAQDANDVRLARQLAAEGFVCLTFDLAGHGRSEGRVEDFTVAQFLEQAATVYDRLVASMAPDANANSPQSGGFPTAACTQVAMSTPPYVCGSSFGAYLACLLSAQRPVAGLGLRVPANYPDDIFHGPPVAAYIGSGSPREWRSQPRASTENRALAALAAFAGPVQLLAAGRDETIPCQTTENFISAARPGALQYHLLAEATHTLYAIPAMRREAYRLVREWLLAQTGHAVARA